MSGVKKNALQLIEKEEDALYSVQKKYPLLSAKKVPHEKVHTTTTPAAKAFGAKVVAIVSISFEKVSEIFTRAKQE